MIGGFIKCIIKAFVIYIYIANMAKRYNYYLNVILVILFSTVGLHCFLPQTSHQSNIIAITLQKSNVFLDVAAQQKTYFESMKVFV